jgi:hypothetical protein
MLDDTLAYASKTRQLVEQFYTRKRGATVGEVTILYDRAKTLRSKIAAIQARVK